jgi:hypothetical protein
MGTASRVPFLFFERTARKAKRSTAHAVGLQPVRIEIPWKQVEISQRSEGQLEIS